MANLDIIKSSLDESSSVNSHIAADEKFINNLSIAADMLIGTFKNKGCLLYTSDAADE